jgi:hypothetical protein
MDCSSKGLLRGGPLAFPHTTLRTITPYGTSIYKAHNYGIRLLNLTPLRLTNYLFGACHTYRPGSGLEKHCRDRHNTRYCQQQQQQQQQHGSGGAEGGVERQKRQSQREDGGVRAIEHATRRRQPVETMAYGAGTSQKQWKCIQVQLCITVTENSFRDAPGGKAKW